MSHPNDQYTRALQRLVDTLNSRGVAERVDRAFAGDAILQRFDPGEDEGGDCENINGSHAIARWMARVPVTTKFALAGKCHVIDGRTPPAAKVRYKYEWNGFIHGGTWVVQLANDGRLSHWAHHPDVMTAAKEQVHASATRGDEQPFVADTDGNQVHAYGNGHTVANAHAHSGSTSGRGGGGGGGGGGGRKRRRGGRSHG